LNLQLWRTKSIATQCNKKDASFLLSCNTTEDSPLLQQISRENKKLTYGLFESYHEKPLSK
jgi:hypothetical protein